MRKTLRILLICALVVGMSVNPASAWHWFRGRDCGGYSSYGWGSYSSSCYGYGGHGYHGGSYGGYYGYARTSYYGGGCGDCGGYSGGYDGYGYDGYGYSDGCGCGYGGEVGGVIETDGSYMEEGTVLEGAPVVPDEAPAPGTRRMPPPQERERPMTTTPRPELPPEPMPEATEPAPTEPADDLFAPEMEEATPPATEPEATTPPVTPPSTTPATPPAEESEDIFGPSEPAEPPATTPATPAETPDTETDDLFGTGTTEETPSTPAATEPATEEGAADELFGTEPAGATEGAATPPAEGTEATEEAPAEGAPAEEATDDDIFGTSTSILREPGGLASAELRTWIDNTGKHSCRGRLVRFLDGHVRILKDNGRTTTVPLYRLSTNDLSFVNRQASAQEAAAPGQVAQSPSPEPLAAN